MAIFRKLLILSATILVISTVPMACVNNQKTQAPINAELEPRVFGRWDKLMGKRFDEAYEYFSPAYRKLYPVQYYLLNTGSSINWLSAEIRDIQFDGIRAEVKVEVEYRLQLPIGQGGDFGEMSKSINEIWLWKQGEWWYVSDDTDSSL